MSTRSRLACAFTVLSATTASSFAATPTPVAVSGSAAPGGGTYAAFANPVLNAAGQVVFNASVTGGTSASGIFTGTTPGSLQAVALQGTAAPGGGLYGTLYTNATTATATLNGGGQLAFIAPLTGGTSTSGVFTGTSAATLQAVALQGTAAPSGGNYNGFAATGINTASSPTLNASGQVAFSATLTGGTPSPGAGIFTGTPGALQAAALLGGTAPGGGTFTTTVTAPVINGNGQVAFVSLLGATTPQGIFAGSPGALQRVMLQGTTALGTGGQLYGTPGSGISYNNAGQTAFIASLTVGDSTSATPSTTGVFVGAPGAVQPVALNNTPAPGGSGGTFTSFTNVTINSAGRAAFGAPLTGGTAATGLFVGTPGSVQAVALVGGTAPNGAAFQAFLSGQVQNGVGQVAFVASLSGANVVTGTGTGANDAALFAGLPGNLMEVVRKGDVIDVDAGVGVDLRTVGGVTNPFGFLLNAGGQDGKGIDFADNGLIAYRLTFTDGSIGVFTSVVPEPAALSLMALTAGGLLRRRRAVSAKRSVVSL